MKAREMRLRLVVRRHALPETRIILPVSLEEDPSVADLIELVNGVVPLESEDWGLEDYVAELHDGEGSAFDLLHFQRVISVLKPDEEVFIRPLLTNDRRQRRLAGRDQITNDGRHLIDGVPFGRPRFKAPRSRPSISIPPLKRRRISDDHDEDIDNNEDDDERPHKAPSVRFNDLPDDASDTAQEPLKQLGTGHEDGGDSHDDDNDGDFVVDEEEEEDQEGDHDEDFNPSQEDLEQELEDLRVDGDELEGPEGADNEVGEEPNVEVADVLLTLTDIDRITALRTAFPTASFKMCEGSLVNSELNPETAYNRLKLVYKPAMSYEDMINYSTSLRGGYLRNRADADRDAQSVASNADSVDSFVKHYDQHGFPAGSILAGTAATHVAEALRRSGKAVKLPVHTHFDDNLDRSLQATRREWNGFKEGSDNGDSSSSDSDSGPEEESSKPIETLTDEIHNPASSESSGDEDSSSDEDDSSDSGSSSDSSSDSDSDSDSDVDGDADANVDEDSDDDASFKDRSDGGSSDSPSDSSEDSGDSDSDSESSKGAPLPSISKTAHSSNDAPGTDQPTSPQLLPAFIPPQVTPGKGTTQTQKRNARRRAARQAKRLQRESGTNADIEMEDQASQDQVDLAQRKAALIELLINGQDDGNAAPTESGDATGAPNPSPPEIEDPEPWRKKITYRAVECCQQGIELSEPPFPFYQRWDPQQQKKQRSSKRKQRDQSEYNDEDSQFKKQRKNRYSGHGAEDEDDDALWDTSYATAGQYDDSNLVLNYDDETEQPVEDTGAATTGGQDAEDDLPSLPIDVSCLPLLGPGEAKPGMILTWKQMILSKATNWTPQVFNLTGSVVDVYDDGSLRVLLAKRDRGVDRSEKQYDEEGNRVYEKFEFPGMEDDELEEEMELGYRTLDSVDMMETRILQQPPHDASPTSPSSQRDLVPPEEPPAREDMAGLEGDSNKSSSGDQSTTLDHDDGVIPESQAYTKSDCQQSSGSVIPETNDSSPDFVENPRASLLNVDQDLSMTEDRRREISQLINDTGFRKEVDPSISEEMNEKLPSVPSSSPSRQLEENLKEAVSAAASTHHLSSFSNPSHQDISQATSNSSMSVDSQPIILEPFHGFSDGIEEDASEDPVEYPTLDLPPSDIGSIHSGRQPDPDFSIDLGNTSPDRLDSVADEPLPPPRAKTPPVKEEKKVKKVSPAKSDTSTNSFPSLSEIFLTASTQATQITQSSTSQEAISSALKARKSDVASDLEYEEAMRKLDDSFASSDSEVKSRKVGIKSPQDTARSLLRKPIEKPTIKRAAVKEELVKGEMVKEETKKASTKMAKASTQKTEASTRPIRATRKSDSFVIPAGSQVVSLISSSPEPELEENYAEDDVDETHEADSFRSEHDSPISPEKSRSRRGASMPLSALASSRRGNNLPKRFASSQGGKHGRSSMPPARKQNKKKTTTRGW